ncbi:hypothetical protein OHD50_02925 [Escherichia coli]|nr:hypothetical protein [Escherichia coli]
MSKLVTFIQHAVNAVPVSGTSLISSLYGDSLSIVVVKSGWVVWLLCWKGWDLVSVSWLLTRLNKEGWLDVSASGDAVFYSLSDKACA